MTDIEIKKYLDKNNWSVDPQDFIINVLNNFEKQLMTIITPNNKFSFIWNIKNIV